jgi:DNA-directed RNA polymerase specialized sigma24 family protein
MAEASSGSIWRTLDISAPGDDEQLLAVNDALERLCAIDPQKAELEKKRYFVGMTLDEAALVLGISKATAKRWWAYSRAWLFGELKGQDS